MSSRLHDPNDVQVQNAVRNLEWLCQYEPPNRPFNQAAHLVSGVPFLRDSLSLPKCGLVMQTLIDWSNSNKDTIAHAKSKQVFGGKADIDWRTAFLPFMESMVVYLRDVSLHVAAWNKMREFGAGSRTEMHLLDEAVDLFLGSTSRIQKIADLWDMDFQVLCDLPGNHPDGHPGWDGPYCGLFTSRQRAGDTSTTAPFQGIVFKGTSPIQEGQWKVDFNYQLIPATKGFLDDKKVSEGVFTTLFGDYKTLDDIPYRTIQNLSTASAAALSKQAEGLATMTHVTGHSLGASYASMCYAQLLMDVAPPAGPGMLMGDQYTFGSPRIGGNEWAGMNKSLAGAQKGQTWRIVNENDLVPQVPPTNLPRMQDLVDFHHLDNGIQIFSDKSPKRLPSEINQPNLPPYPIVSIWDFLTNVMDSIDHRQLPSTHLFYHISRTKMKRQSPLDTTIRCNMLSIQPKTSLRTVLQHPNM